MKKNTESLTKKKAKILISKENEGFSSEDDGLFVENLLEDEQDSFEDVDDSVQIASDSEDLPSVYSKENLLKNVEKNDLTPFSYGSTNDYIKKIFAIPNLTDEEEKSLIKDYIEKKDQKAGQKIIVSHLKLVVKIAYRYKRYSGSLFDLFAEGNMGLLHALKKFKPSKGIKFATYATFWVRTYVQDYIVKTWSSIRNKSKDLKKHLFSKEKDPTINLVKEVSLERFVYDDDNQIYQIEEEENFVDNLILEDRENLRKKLLQEAISKLDERTRYILDERFFKDTKMTLGELSEKLKISKERIRQIEEKSINFIKDYIKENYNIDNY